MSTPSSSENKYLVCLILDGELTKSCKDASNRVPADVSDCHIPLFGFTDNINEGQLINILENFVKNYSKSPISLNFSDLGMFPNKKDLFLVPAASIQLLEFHAGLFNELTNFQVPNEYKPDIWFPRATFSVVKEDEQVCEGFAAARKHLGFPLKGSADKLALLQISPDLKRTCWSCSLSSEGGEDSHKRLKTSWQMRKCSFVGSSTKG